MAHRSRRRLDRTDRARQIGRYDDHGPTPAAGRRRGAASARRHRDGCRPPGAGRPLRRKFRNRRQAHPHGLGRDSPVKSYACWKKGWGAASPDWRLTRTGIGPASAKEHPDGENTGIRANTREADGGDRRIGRRRRHLQAGPAGGAADYRGGAGERGARRAGARLLRARRGAWRRLSQRLSNGSVEERGGGDRVQRAADCRSRHAVSLGDSRDCAWADRRAGGAGSRDVRARAVDPRHEALFADADGHSLLSRTAVSEITERLWAESEGFAGRELAEFEVVYLFVDGIAERLHLGQPREAVLAAWGLLADGKKALLHLAPGTKEDTASCREFFRDMRRRGLPDPLLVVSDGAPGIIRAIEECFPRALRQRCLAHKMRNLASKVPEDLWPEFKARATACYQAASPALARLLREDLRTTYDRDLPSAVACLEDDFEACIAHLRFPLGHRRAIRTTNLLERLFGEERRRTKVIPHAFGETAVLKLLYAALHRDSERWRGTRISEFEHRQLRAVREDIDEDFAARNAPATTAPQPHLSSNQRT